MGSIDLPHKHSADIHLVTATQEELDAQQIVNSDEWRGALSLDAYLRREKHLSSQELTWQGGLTAWSLVYQPDTNGPRQVLCGCETIRNRALVAKDGAVHDTVCHSVGSVFCPPQYRGRGFAGRMMEDLGKTLQSWQAESAGPSLFSTLYSDIGKDFYAARGWHPFPSAHLVFPACTQPPSANVRLLEREDIAELCSSDETLLRRQMSDLNTSKVSAVAVIPDHQRISWHHAREDFVGRELYGKSPAVKGALVKTPDGTRIWAYFTRVWSNPQEDTPNTLHILRLVVENDSTSNGQPGTVEGAAALRGSEIVKAIAAILRAAQSQAVEWDMKEVNIWNPASATLAAVQSIDSSAAVIHRETESIASLRWYGEGSWKDVEWICNEKYGWN